MPGGDETDVVAVVAGGRALAEAALRCWDTGRAILPVNPAFTGAEITALLDRLRPTAVARGADDLDAAPARPDGVRAPGGIVAVVVTSGTSGAPKGVELTRAGMEAMGHGYSAGLDAGPADRWLACLPLHHVASLGALARSYVTGVPCTVHDSFDLERVARSPRTEGTTMVSVVPTVMRRLLDSGAPLHEYRRVIVGGAPCPPALRARAESAGVGVVDAYGLSETWGGFTLDGLPIDGAHARIGADDEILVRGAMVMHGYRLDPALTAAAIDTDGWFHTGDIGTIDADGRVRVVDRLKDLVITGGVNVSPTEVESVLLHHPDVADVCVVGVPDDEWGERVVAFVVARAGAPAPSVDELRAFGREHLSGPKLPRAARVGRRDPAHRERQAVAAGPTGDAVTRRRIRRTGRRAAANGLPGARSGSVVTEGLLPGAEPSVHDTVGTGPFTRAVREQAVGEPAIEILRVDPDVAGIRVHRRSGPPQEVTTDPALERDQIDAEIGAEREHRSGCLHPAGRGNEVVALRERRQFVGVPVAIGRRPFFGRSRHVVPCSHACRPSPTSPLPRSSSTASP